MQYEHERQDPAWSWLPEEFWAAIDAGGDYELRQTVAEEWWPYPCDDKDCPARWHKHAFGTDFVVEQGVPFVEVNECDADGNWDVYDGHEMFTADFAAWFEGLLRPEDFTAAWREYYRFVVATGEDPLDEFFVSPRTKRVAWQARFAEALGDEALLVGARRNTRGKWVAGDALPEAVRAVLSVERRGVRWYFSEGWRRLNEILDSPERDPIIPKVYRARSRQRLFAVLVEESVPASPAKLRAAARRALQQ